MAAVVLRLDEERARRARRPSVHHVSPGPVVASPAEDEDEQDESEIPWHDWPRERLYRLRVWSAYAGRTGAIRGHDHEADETEAARWSLDVVALLRSGVRLRAAVTSANEDADAIAEAGGEEGQPLEIPGESDRLARPPRSVLPEALERELRAQARPPAAEFLDFAPEPTSAAETVPAVEISMKQSEAIIAFLQKVDSHRAATAVICAAVAKQLGASENAVALMLGKMAARGELVRVARGVYELPSTQLRVRSSSLVKKAVEEASAKIVKATRKTIDDVARAAMAAAPEPMPGPDAPAGESDSPAVAALRSERARAMEELERTPSFVLVKKIDEAIRVLTS